MLEFKDVLVFGENVLDGDTGQHFGVGVAGLSITVVANFIGWEMLEAFVLEGHLFVMIFHFYCLDGDVVQAVGGQGRVVIPPLEFHFAVGQVHTLTMRY